MTRTFGDEIWQGVWLTLPLYPWFNEETRQVYSCNIFRSMQTHNITFEQLEQILNKWTDIRNELFGKHCHNREVYLVRENLRFAFMALKDGEFIIWNDFSYKLGSYKIDFYDIPSDEFIKWVDKITLDYCNDKIVCSGCNKKINKKDIAGRIFAGIYCKDCWETKYKEEESKINYD